MNPLERFLAIMEYQPVDRVPNWELGVWPQTRDRWEAEGLDSSSFHWDWFMGEAALGMDPREFIHFNGAPLPPFEVRRALKEGACPWTPTWPSR